MKVPGWPEFCMSIHTQSAILALFGEGACHDLAADLYERWATAIEWDNGHEFGSFQYLKGVQDSVLAAEGGSGAFPRRFRTSTKTRRGRAGR
jgi:hypothetical protein